MKKLDQLNARLKTLTPQKLEEILLGVIRDYSKQIIDLNQDQLQKGKNSQGKPLGKYVSKSYAKYKKKLNPRGVVDLKLTGKFYDSFFVQAQKFPVFVDAKDSKTPKLKKKYEFIFNLTPHNKQSYNKAVRLEFIARVRKAARL